MTVSERDREYMRRIGEYKAAAHSEAAARHRALPLGERLRRSWQLSVAGRAGGAPAARADDDAAVFYALARARGMIGRGGRR
ncbi:MAG: hypothetical protein ABI629_12210 [bacterium]